MADEDNGGAAAPAETNPVLSFGDAVAALDAQDTQDDQEQQAQPAEGQQQPDPEPQAAPEATDEPAEEAEAPADSAEPETQPEAEAFVDGNVKTRLRDGTVTTVGELKKLADRAKELERQVSAPPEELPAVKERLAQLNQREQELQHLSALALQLAAIPDEPDISLLHSDPIEYSTRKEMREIALKKANQVAQYQQQQQQQAQEQQSKAFEKFVAEQRDALQRARPEVKDPAKAKELYETVKKGAVGVGFSEQDVEKTYDHRLLLMAEKAARWDAHLSEQAKLKPVVEAKAKDAVPVQKPGPRTSPSTTKAAKADELFRRVERNRDIDSAVAYLNALDG